MTGKKTAVRLSFESLEGRAVPAHVSGGNLLITGSDAADYVVARDMQSGERDVIRVIQNGVVRDFDAADVTGRVVFRGRGGNDRFGYIGSKVLLAEGGGGSDVLGVVGGPAILLGGAGSDILLGGSGDDILVGGPGHDRLEGRGGRDELIDEQQPRFQTLIYYFVPGTEFDSVRHILHSA